MADAVVIANVVRIGNSLGIRIPRPLLEQAGIHDRVELVLQDGQLCVRPVRHPREGWAEQLAAETRDHPDEPPEDDWPPTDFDLNEWTW